MRILLVTLCANNEWTGMGKWSYEVARGLTALGHDTTLWFDEQFSSVNGLGAVASVFVKPVLVAARIARCASEFDVVLIHEPTGFWYSAMRRMSPELPPMVCMCHNIDSSSYKKLDAG